jgi:hypothetical protein
MWALLFPNDQKPHAWHIYETRAEAIEEATCGGDAAAWSEAKKAGFRVVRVLVTEAAGEGG